MGKPVKVFIIMGQSNTLEMGKVKGDKEGSLEYAVQKEKLYPFMVDAAGAWTKRMDVRNVHTQGSGGPDGRGGVRRNDWLTVSGNKIGIETGIGHQLGNALDSPVLILKSSIGNRSLGWDLLPPGSPRHEVETVDKKTGKKVTLMTPAFNDECVTQAGPRAKCPSRPSTTGMPVYSMSAMSPVPRRYSKIWRNIIPAARTLKWPASFGGRETRTATTRRTQPCTEEPRTVVQGTPQGVQRAKSQDGGGDARPNRQGRGHR